MKKKAQEIKDLVDIEFAMKVNLDTMVYGFNLEEKKLSLVDLETRKRTILCDWEKEARQKSRALWLLCRDNNTPFSINLLLIGKILTQFGKLKMTMVI